MSTLKPQLLVGVSAGINSIHTIIVRQEVEGKLRLMGEHRYRHVTQNRDELQLVQRVKESIEQAIEDAQVKQEDILTIGVSSPGQIDIDNGAILYAPLFEVKKNPFPFIERMRDYFDVPHITLINNDDAPGIAEQRIGEGKGIQHMVYLRLGYTIGAGIIIDGKLYTGASNLAGTFGHMSVDRNGPECNCGNRGCLEALVSREAVAKQLQQRYRNGEQTILADRLNRELPDINSAVLADAIDQEDDLTCKVIEEAAEVFGIGIANVINFLNPERVILGGDMNDEIDLFFEKAVESGWRRSLPASRNTVSIVRGRLRTTAGAYGAAVFAKEHLLKIQEQQAPET
ncbi:MAG TPA: ROK family protein [Ktedonosporobacter sp.]|nr:ROK family protein [Ktedonosporobacter sp.]